MPRSTKIPPTVVGLALPVPMTRKSADIIVLDQNLFDVKANRIVATKVLTTYFEGRAVYRR